MFVLLKQKIHTTKHSQKFVPASRTAQIILCRGTYYLPIFHKAQRSFEKWSKEISNAGKLKDFTDYDRTQAAEDVRILQTSSPNLRERTLQKNVKHDELIKLGIAKEQSQKVEAMLEIANGKDPHPETRYSQEVRCMKLQNAKLKARIPGKFCERCRKTRL